MLHLEDPSWVTLSRGLCPVLFIRKKVEGRTLDTLLHSDSALSTLPLLLSPLLLPSSPRFIKWQELLVEAPSAIRWFPLIIADIGLAKKFIQFCSITSYGKIWTNFLTNPILCGSTHLPPSLTGKSERQEVQKDLTWLIHLWAGFGPPQVCQMFKRWILLWVLLKSPTHTKLDSSRLQCP